MTAEIIDTLHASFKMAMTGTLLQNKSEDIGALCKIIQSSPFNDPKAFAKVSSLADNL